MSELTLTVIKLGFLAILWLLVLSVTSAVRADLFGVRPTKPPREERAARAARQPRPARGTPTKAVVVEGPDRGREVALGSAPVTFGRGEDCTLSLRDEYVSTRHARLRQHDGQWYAEDLGSTNGTYLGGERLTQPAPVGARSQAKLGKTVLELRRK